MCVRPYGGYLLGWCFWWSNSATYGKDHTKLKILDSVLKIRRGRWTCLGTWNPSFQRKYVVGIFAHLIYLILLVGKAKCCTRCWCNDEEGNPVPGEPGHHRHQTDSHCPAQTLQHCYVSSVVCSWHFHTCEWVQNFR